jgi:hypothetical protein
MSEQADLQPALRRQAAALTRRLLPAEREALLVKCWMSHDARWFMAVAKECGLAVANRLNQSAARGVGQVEAQRIERALQLPPVQSLDDYLLRQEQLINLLGPELLDYDVSKVSADSGQMQVRRCFAHENAARAGILDQYECGIFARVAGWLDATGLPYELQPALGKCLKAQGHECVYSITVRPAEQA